MDATLFDAQVTFCFTGDLDRTAEFYEQVLGLPLALDQGRCR
jgi:catechol 2,3-dioxygenase-like lactoylglutathione lyase family enzyme